MPSKKKQLDPPGLGVLNVVFNVVVGCDGCSRFALRFIKPGRLPAAVAITPETVIDFPDFDPDRRLVKLGVCPVFQIYGVRYDYSTGVVYIEFYSGAFDPVEVDEEALSILVATFKQRGWDFASYPTNWCQAWAAHREGTDKQHDEDDDEDDEEEAVEDE